MAKRVGCARKICRAELEEVPPNARAGSVVVEMPSVVARVGTVNVPTTGCFAQRIDVRHQHPIVAPFKQVDRKEIRPTRNEVAAIVRHCQKCRVERKAVPPNATPCGVTVEVPSAEAPVGTASVPTYGLRVIRFEGHA